MSFTLTAFPAWLKAHPRGALTEVSKTSDVSWSTVSRAADGKPVGLRSGLAIARVTGIPLRELVRPEVADAYERATSEAGTAA